MFRSSLLFNQNKFGVGDDEDYEIIGDLAHSAPQEFYEQNSDSTSQGKETTEVENEFSDWTLIDLSEATQTQSTDSKAAETPFINLKSQAEILKTIAYHSTAIINSQIAIKALPECRNNPRNSMGKTRLQNHRDLKNPNLLDDTSPAILSPQYSQQNCRDSIGKTTLQDHKDLKIPDLLDDTSPAILPPQNPQQNCRDSDANYRQSGSAVKQQVIFGSSTSIEKEKFFEDSNGQFCSAINPYFMPGSKR